VSFTEEFQVDVRQWNGGHPSDALLEEYTFGRLTEGEAERLEEHYLHCDSCLEALEETESQVAVIRSSFAREALTPRKQPMSFWDKLGWKAKGTWLAYQLPIASGALALVCVIGISQFRSSTPSPSPTPIMLASFRGSSPVTQARGPAGRPLELRLDASDVAAQPSFRLELVDEAGSLQWNGTAAASSGQVLAQVPVGLRAGQYWVRLYSHESELVREFGLRLD
jgi:hypothetical protein